MIDHLEHFLVSLKQKPLTTEVIAPPLKRNARTGAPVVVVHNGRTATLAVVSTPAGTRVGEAVVVKRLHVHLWGNKKLIDTLFYIKTYFTSLFLPFLQNAPVISTEYFDYTWSAKCNAKCHMITCLWIILE